MILKGIARTGFCLWRWAGVTPQTSGDARPSVVSRGLGDARPRSRTASRPLRTSGAAVPDAKPMQAARSHTPRPRQQSSILAGPISRSNRRREQRDGFRQAGLGEIDRIDQSAQRLEHRWEWRPQFRSLQRAAPYEADEAQNELGDPQHSLLTLGIGTSDSTRIVMSRTVFGAGTIRGSYARSDRRPANCVSPQLRASSDASAHVGVWSAREGSGADASIVAIDR